MIAAHKKHYLTEQLLAIDKKILADRHPKNQKQVSTWDDLKAATNTQYLSFVGGGKVAASQMCVLSF